MDRVSSSSQAVWTNQYQWWFIFYLKISFSVVKLITELRLILQNFKVQIKTPFKIPNQETFHRRKEINKLSFEFQSHSNFNFDQAK